MTEDFDANKSLEDIRKHGIAAELTNYYKAKALYVCIGEHADELNSGHFGQLFAQLQNYCVVSLLLALSKRLAHNEKKSAIGNPSLVDLARNGPAGGGRTLLSGHYQFSGLQPALLRERRKPQRLVYCFASSSNRLTCFYHCECS